MMIIIILQAKIRLTKLYQNPFCPRSQMAAYAVCTLTKVYFHKSKEDPDFSGSELSLCPSETVGDLMQEGGGRKGHFMG